MDTPTATGISSSTPIKLRIDALSPKQFNLFSTTVLLIIGVIFFLASNVPNAYVTENRLNGGCFAPAYKDLDYTCQDFSITGNPILSIKISDVDTASKFLALDLSLMRKDSGPESITANIEISAFTVSGDEVIDRIFIQKRSTLEFDCSAPSGSCDFQRIYSFGNLENKNYLLVLKFMNAGELSTMIGDVYVTSTALNVTFRNYIFAVKLLLLVVSLVGIFLIYTNIKELHKDVHIFQQKFLLFVSPMLITIDEPFTVHILEGSMYTWMTTLSFVFFAALLIYFWFTIFFELAGSDSSLIERSSRFVKVYSIILFFAMTFAYITLSTDGMRNPTYDVETSARGFIIAFYGLMYIALTVGFAWGVMKVVRIVRRINQVTDRESTFFWFSLFFVLCHFYLVYRGGLYPFTRNGNIRLLFCGVSTVYILATGFLYSPTEEGLAQAKLIAKYDKKEVRSSYKDLEMSVDQGKKANPSTKESPVEIHSGNKMTLSDGKYPYENKNEEM